MDQNMSLNVEITAEAGQATTQFDNLNARLSAMEVAFNRGSAGAQNIARDVEKMGSSTEKAAGSVSKLGNVGKFIEDVGSHYRIASNAAEIFGIKSEAAAAKLDGLVRIFDGMKTAVPALLAIGTAVTAIFAAFEEAKNAASAAADWQQKMSILGATVRNQGGDWRSLSSAVSDWAEVQEKTTAFSRDEAVQALTTLTATGMKLSDAMIVTRVSEDAAAATGRSLTEVNFALSEAMHGRTQALTQLGLGTKQSIKDGMSFRDILKEIEKHMGGAAAAAADTYAGKVAQLHNALQTLQEKIGSAVLPALTGLAKALINLIQNAENTFSRWEKALQHWAAEHKSQIEAIEGFLKGGLDVFRAVFDAIAGLVKGAVQTFAGFIEFLTGAFTGDWRGAWEGVRNMFEGVLHGMLGMFGTWGDNIIVMAERVAKGVGGIFSHIFAGMGAMMHGDVKGAIADLNQMFSGFGGIGSGLNWNFHDTVSGIQDAFSGHGGESNSADIGGLSSGLSDTMVGGKLGGIAKHLNHIAKAAKKAKEQLEAFDVALYSIQDPLKGTKSSSLLSAVVGSDTTNPMYGVDEKQNAKMQAELQKRLAEAQKQWEQYYKSLEENAKQWTDKTAGWIEEMFSRGKKGVNSFAETFKNILKEIEQALLKSALFEFFMGAQGAKGQSFGSIFASYMGFGSHSSGSSGGNRTPNSSGGIIGSLIGTSSATQLASSLPTDSLMSLMFGVGAPSATNDSGASGAISGAATVIAGAGGPGGGTNAGYASLLGNNSGNIASLLGTSGGQAAAGIALAVGFGDAFAALIHGGNNNGSTYGTWGMIGGLLAGIPGAIIGSLFGHKDNPANMPDKYNTTDFGQIVANLTGAGGGQYHSTDPTAPASHNWFGANGQKFFSNIGSLTGGGSGIGWIEETLAKYANPDGSMGPNTPDWLKPMWSQLVSAFGISASGSGQLNFGHNIGQEWVTGAQGASSNPTSYTNLGDLMNQFIQNYLTQGSVGVNPYSPPGNNGSGFNVSSPFAGAYMVGTPGSTPTLVNGAPSFNMGSDPNAPGRVTMPVSTQPITVNVTVQGNVTAENNLADTIKQRIEEHIIRGHIGNSMALGGVGF